MKNKLFKGLSLSANPKHLIKGAFSAAQRVFAEFGVKNHTFENNKLRNNSIKVSGLLRVARNDICSVGRSMIEMLGVLAIIGVLSVGGIAGYSKAMEKFKVDKAIGEYSQLIIGLMEHKNSLSKLDANQDYGTDLADFVEAANLVPQSWKKVDSLGFNDAYGNRIHTYTNNSKDIAIDFYLGGYEENEDSKRVSKAFNTKVCEEIFNNMAKPLQSSLKKAWLWGTKVEFYGNSYCCPNCKCLNKLTLSEIHQACNSCIKDTFCAIVFWF